MQPEKIIRIDEGAFFVLGDFTAGIINFEKDKAQTSSIIEESFEKVPELEITKNKKNSNNKKLPIQKNV